MATYTYGQLKDMTVAALREIAQGLKHESLEGCMTMHKDHLLPAMCKVLGIETHHVAHGEAKAKVKAMIRTLSERRTQAIAAKDHARLAQIRRAIHVSKRKLRQMAIAGAAEAASAAAKAAPAEGAAPAKA